MMNAWLNNLLESFYKYYKEKIAHLIWSMVIFSWTGFFPIDRIFVHIYSRNTYFLHVNLRNFWRYSSFFRLFNLCRYFAYVNLIYLKMCREITSRKGLFPWYFFPYQQYEKPRIITYVILKSNRNILIFYC